MHKTSASRTAIAVALIAVVYFLAGKFGLSLAVVHPSASAIWPPSGLALAALLLWGFRLWPGIFVGAFLVNITTQGNLLTALAIASGNTLEALFGAWLIDQFANGRKFFERARNILKFVVLAGLVSTMVSPTIGLTSLTLSSYAPSGKYAAIWLTWWLGDATGDLLVTPLLVIWLTQAYPELRPRRIVEAAALLFSLVSVSAFVFRANTGLSLEYLAILPLLWAAFRFGQRGAVTAAFFLACIALIGTVQGFGPFASVRANESLLELQGFTGTVAIAALVLASVISERSRAEQRLDIQAAVSRFLATSPDLKEAGPRILQLLCERAKWATGAIWNVDRAKHALVCVEFCNSSLMKTPLFEATTRQQTFARGIGLPGRVWNSGNAAWIPDVTKDDNFPRAPVAAKEGLRAAVGFPVKIAGETLFIIECFSSEVREPDEDSLGMMADIGAQIGRFIERKQSENDNAVLNQRLRAVVDTAADGIITIDERGIIRAVNAAAERIFRYSAPEMVGQNVRILMPEGYRREHDAYLGNYLRTGEKRIIGLGREVQGQRKDGTIFPADLAVSETRLGDYRAFTGIVRDITERKQTELLLKQTRDELLQANEQLERRVQQRTADLERANAALLENVEGQRRLEEQLRQAQKMESIGTLAGGIAHDFNNILNIIRGYATLLSAQAPADPQVIETMKIISRQVDRGASVVRQLLTLARKTETRLVSTDVNQIIIAVGELIKQTFPRTIEVKLRLDPKLPAVLADANQINQALINLCVNARDAMPAGGELGIASEVVHRQSPEHGDSKISEDLHVCIAIADSGSGIEESVRPRIFEPFFTTKPFGEGTGLGLAMVYGIMKNHRGVIDFESEIGRGTTFRLYLPALRADDESTLSEPKDAQPPPQSLARAKATILVVEDEPSMVALLQKVLARNDYRVMAALDGAQAIELYQQYKEEIDVALVDLGLPKVSGIEVIRVMKAENPRVKIIVTTGYLEPGLKSELFRNEVREYIQKPYSVENILEKLESALDYC